MITGAGITVTVKLCDAEAFTFAFSAWLAVITAVPSAQPVTSPFVVFTAAVKLLFDVYAIAP